MPHQSLAAVLMALGVSIAQSLLDRGVAVPHTHLPAMSVDPAMHHDERFAPRSVPSTRMAEPATTLPPDLAIGKAFDDAVRRALTHLCDPTKLSLSPLLHLALVTAGLDQYGLEDTRLHRAAILKGMLVALVQELRPRQQAGGPTDGAWRFYNCLYYPYVRGVTRRQAPAVVRALRERREREGGPSTEQERVLEWLLQVDEDTYYKWQRRASDTLALILREREGQLGGAMLAEGRRAGMA